MQRKPVYLMLALFILPILTAKLILINGWYNGAETNLGTLITPPIPLKKAPKSWILLYNPPEVCQQQCQHNLWQIQQVHTLLAAEGDRVKRYLLSPISVFPANQVENNNQQPFQYIAANKIPLIFPTSINKKRLSLNNLYLIDPLGNIFMQYQFPPDNKEVITAAATAAGLLQDLKRLLKVSKIG